LLKRITFAGIDRFVKPAELIAFHREFPFVEFGFLVSKALTGQNKNPRYTATVMLKAFKKDRIPMALHVCGALAMDLIKKDNWEGINAIMGDTMQLFDRIQINAAAARHMKDTLSFPEGKQVILQLQDGNDTMWEKYASQANVVAFQDNSGGTGKYEGAWRAPVGEFFGYGGGLNPENAVEAVRAMQQVCDADFWIDMESGVRTNDKFDLKKCREVCNRLMENGLIP